MSKENNGESIVQKTKRLCDEGLYDEAIALTNEIEIRKYAIEAHLLCIEHEHRRFLDSKK